MYVWVIIPEQFQDKIRASHPRQEALGFSNEIAALEAWKPKKQ